MILRSVVARSRLSFLVVVLILFPSLLVAENGEDRKEALRFLIMDLHQAASTQDLKSLGKLLPPVFKYSFGGDDTREGAIKFYKEYPGKLRNLANVLEAGCKKEGENYFTCPPQNADKDVIYFGPRAEFEYDPKAKKWVIVWFVEGD